MLTSELDYSLPPELIAQHPVIPRDLSRLLVYNRETREMRHRRLPGLLDYLNPGDVIVYNDSRVLKARVHVFKETGGRVELLFLRRRQERLWEALVRPSAKLKSGSRLSAAAPAAAGMDAPHFMLEENLGGGRWLVRNLSGAGTEQLLEQVGEMPLPPYIKAALAEPERYQTVYARAPGSAAAPTAGLHFTPELIGRIRSLGVDLLPLTLHIGLDTFRPISETDLGLHRIHKERYRLPAASYEAVVAAKERGGRVLAVGTTSVRVLETVFQDPSRPLEGETGLFITPGFRFRAVDALLTNFHLPKSTLLALVMAFAGVKEIRRLYQAAVQEKYRFYSFGDAMLLL